MRRSLVFGGESMGIFELIMIAVGLSMDAFAVSVCKGLAIKKVSLKEPCIVGLWFGGFQALMPAIGCALGAAFEKYITPVDHWVAFFLLGVIGANMIKEALSNDEEKTDDSLCAKGMLAMAVATSIDALAVGITFAFLIEGVGHLIFAFSAIGITTFILSAIGVKVGNIFGVKYKSKAELAGGIILILLGAKILLEHLGMIG